MIKAIIIDDELECRMTLRNFLKIYCPNVNIIGEANTVVTGLDLLSKQKPDVLFLDIEMPDGTGFQLLEQVEEVLFEVVFTTAHDQFALKAFKYSAVDYLLKPIQPNELIKAVERISDRNTSILNRKLDVLVRTYLKNDFKKIALPTIDGLEFVPIEEITRCEADRSYTTFILADGKKILVAKRLKEYEKLLPPNLFIRVHRSHLININYIKKYKKEGYVIMSDGAAIEIPRRRRQEFVSLISNL